MMIRRFEVIEDNAGGLHLFVLEQDMVTYGATSTEHHPEQLRDMLYALLNGSCPLAEGWETQDTDPQTDYDTLTSTKHGWEIVAIGEYDTDTQIGDIEYRRGRMGFSARHALPEGWAKEYPPLKMARKQNDFGAEPVDRPVYLVKMVRGTEGTWDETHTDGEIILRTLDLDEARSCQDSTAIVPLDECNLGGKPYFLAPAIIRKWGDEETMLD